MKYIKTSLTDSKFSELLKHHISNGIPLSMTRLGDGEIGFINKTLNSSIKQRFCDVWGYTRENYDEGEVLVIEILLRALRMSDIVGIMDLNNPVCKKMGCSEKVWSLPEEKLVEIGRTKDMVTCDHQACRGKLLGNVNNFKDILNGTDIHIISPRVKQLRNKNLDKLLECNVSFTNVNMGAKLYDRDKVFGLLDNIKESVVIVSLGLIGKDIPQYLAQEKGKICLDFGATVDAWAGIKSRDWFGSGGLQNHCLIK